MRSRSRPWPRRFRPPTRLPANWEKLVPDKNWNDIKNIVNDVMENGEEGPYKSVFSKKKIIDGYEVEVTYNKLSDGTVRISDAWINP